MQSLRNFLIKRGLPALLYFAKALNDGMPASQLAVHFGVSEPRIIQWKHAFFERRYIFSRSAEEFLENEGAYRHHLIELELAELKEEMNNGRRFSLQLLIPGAGAREVRARARTALCREAQTGDLER